MDPGLVSEEGCVIERRLNRYNGLIAVYVRIMLTQNWNGSRNPSIAVLKRIRLVCERALILLYVVYT